jgi:AAA+ superfamily predicted ATPase
MLEYYKGILFLTTNRLETMDPAFQSRIHVAIEYKPFDPVVRRQVWENFITRLDEREVRAKKELHEHLDDISEWELNGRQIRNVIGIAETLALSKERRRGALTYRDVESVANETIEFDRFFTDTSKEKKGQVGDINSRQFQEKRFRSLK